MSDGPVYRATDLVDPATQRAARAEVNLTTGTGVAGVGAGLPPNRTMEANDVWRRYPRWPGDPLPGAQERVVDPEPVLAPPEPQSAIPTTVGKLEFDPDAEIALRQRLGDASAELSGAEQALSYAAEAHQRGEVHLSACTKKAAAFAGIDAQAEALANALRAGGEHPNFDAEQRARDLAMDEARRASAACDVLRRSHAEAAAAVGTAKDAVTVTAMALLALAAEVKSRELLAARSRAEALLLELRGLAQTVKGVQFGPETRAVLFADEQSAGYHAADRTRALALIEALRNNPEAPLE
jgi:hypothetical protein